MRFLIPLGLAMILSAPLPASAIVYSGDAAPAFTKNQLDAPPPAARSLSDYPGKIVVFFLFGYNCPFCLADGPSVQNDISAYYDNLRPGHVQVLGADLYNGTAAQVRSFQTQTGATYPLLLQGANATGGNLSTLYGPFDNYVVIDPTGVVRYHASVKWPHGNRYHPDEIKAVVDSILATSAAPEPGSAPPDLVLEARPNPFPSATTITFVNPGTAEAPARVSIFDASGRRVLVLFEGSAHPGENAVSWNGRIDSGSRAASGRYWIRVEMNGRTAVRSVVTIR